jgi:hypothetical protein
VLTGEKEKNANLFCNDRCDLSPIRDSFNTEFGDPSQPQVFYHECNHLPSSLPRQAFHPLLLPLMVQNLVWNSGISRFDSYFSSSDSHFRRMLNNRFAVLVPEKVDV